MNKYFLPIRDNYIGNSTEYDILAVHGANKFKRAGLHVSSWVFGDLGDIEPVNHGGHTKGSSAQRLWRT